MKPLITVDELRRLMPLLSQSKACTFVPYLEAAMQEQRITTRRRRCAFLAQLAHESVQLTKWIENLNYKAERLMTVFPYHFKDLATARRFANKPEAIANRVYGGRMGNVNPGDGWRYRGRGPIGLTGRSNYCRFGDLLGVDLEGDPDQAGRTAVGFRIAGLFWKVGGLNELADKLKMDGSIKEANAFAQITKRINGGVNGLADRINYYRVAKQVLHRDDASEGHTPQPAPAEPSESADGDSNLLSTAIGSSRAKSAGMKLWPRVVRHLGAAGTFVWGLYEANRVATILVVAVLLIGVAWVAYHNRKRVRAWLLEVLK